MKSSYLAIGILLCLLSLLAPTYAENDPNKLDYGDFSPSTLRMKAAGALGTKNFENAIAYADKCIAIYEKQATEQQSKLTEPISLQDRDAILAQWALNEVGTCCLIRGTAYEKLDKVDEAISSYKLLVEKYSYATSLGDQGFWRPVKKAEERLSALSQ